MSCSVDMEELLVQLGSDIAYIEMVYEQAKKDRRIVSVGKPRVKSMLEHSRSILEYSAGAVATLSATRSGRKVYFPYGSTEAEFRRNTLSIFPNLQADSMECYMLFESLQPHLQSEPWLLALCGLANENKHNQLVQQSRGNTDAVVVSVGGMYVFDESSMILVDDPRDCSQALELSSKLAVEEIEQVFKGVQVNTEYAGVSFRFSGYTYDILDFFKRVNCELSDYVDAFKKIFGR